MLKTFCDLKTRYLYKHNALLPLSYKIEFTPFALKQLRGLDNQIKVRIKAKIEEIAAIGSQPAPGTKQLKGAFKGICRARVGDYRILYQVFNEQLTILIVAIGNRKEICG